MTENAKALIFAEKCSSKLGVRSIVSLCVELGVELEVLEVLAQRAYERSRQNDLRANIAS